MTSTRNGSRDCARWTAVATRGLDVTDADAIGALESAFTTGTTLVIDGGMTT